MSEPVGHTERSSGRHHVVPVEEASQVGEARRVSQALATAAGMSELDAGRVTLVVNELATNLVRYARAGCVLLRRCGDDGVEILTVDEGPGMSLATSMRDGHSSASSRGVGLGAVARASDVFDGWSDPSLGTVLLARVFPTGRRAPARRSFEVGVVSDRVTEAWAVHHRGGRLVLGVVEGLDSAKLASLLEHRANETPGALLDGARVLRSPTARGGAVIAVIDEPSRSLTVAGIGRIDVEVVAPEGGSPAPVAIAGAADTAPFEERRPFPSGALLVTTVAASRSRSAPMAELARDHHPALAAALVWRLERPATVLTVTDRRSTSPA